MRPHWIIVLAALGAHCGLALAQTTVYESKDKAGPVFSDKPSPGATAVELPPPNVVSGPKPVPQAPAPSSAAASPPPYRTLAIVSIANDGTIHSNTGAFDFTARSAPALRAGDRVRVRLDGQLLPASFRSMNLRVGESDWQAAAHGDSAAHTLQLAIVDKAGTLLIESQPLRFYVHRASVAGKR